jgi:hypothetical protein
LPYAVKFGHLAVVRGNGFDVLQYLLEAKHKGCCVAGTQLGHVAGVAAVALQFVRQIVADGDEGAARIAGGDRLGQAHLRCH